MPKKKEIIKEPDLTTKAGKYFIARKQGKTKTEAAISVGVTPKNISNLENSDRYQGLVRYFKDELLEDISLKEIATELAKNIRQDTNPGAKNTAIEIALDRIEPKDTPDLLDEKIIVVLKGD